VFVCVFLINCSDTHLLRVGVTCAVLNDSSAVSPNDSVSKCYWVN
jgi:hypothetical protein